MAIITNDDVQDLLEKNDYLVKVKWRKNGCRVIYPTRVVPPRKLTREVLIEKKEGEIKVSCKGQPVRKYNGPEYIARIAMGVVITEGCQDIQYDLSMIKFYDRKNNITRGLKGVVDFPSEMIDLESTVEAILAQSSDALEKRAMAETLGVLDGFDFLLDMCNSGG